MKNHHPEISEDRLFFFEREEVIIDDFDTVGLILDIGGGGRGVIGELKGKQVIAIDPSKSELEGAVDGPLKIIMDATNLQFLDGTFHTATSFYTLMYIKTFDAHEKVFREVYRVLASGGRFLIWDANFPARFDKQKDIAVFPLTVKLPEEEIDAAYGAVWPENGRIGSYYVQLADNAGFEVISTREEGQQLFLELQKP
jgi:ubiquinone/menaquinone biosynthesis C-methylase UbiE